MVVTYPDGRSLMSSSPPNDNSEPQRHSPAVFIAISDPLRVYVLILTEKRRRALRDLQGELPAVISIGELEHHVEILRKAGLIEVAEVRGFNDAAEPQYKARLDALLEILPGNLPEMTFEEIARTSSSGSFAGAQGVEVLLKHPVRRKLLRALTHRRAPSTVTELMGYEGLSKEASSCLNYHARVLATAGLVEVIDELPVYRSLVTTDGTISALLRESEELDNKRDPLD
ncbi:MAG: hypothetical protein ACOYD4_05395 [Solirubrobacterales bacterium]